MDTTANITMSDVRWEATVRRTTVSDERCNVCEAPYESFLDFRCSAPDEFGSIITFLNLPCGHVDPSKHARTAAPEVLARLLLVAVEEPR